MSVEQTCENCIFSFSPYPPFKEVCKDCVEAQHDKDDPDTCFQPFEDLARQDEREKIIAMLEEEIEGLDFSEWDNSFYEENWAVRDFVEKMTNKIKSM